MYVRMGFMAIIGKYHPDNESSDQLFRLMNETQRPFFNDESRNYMRSQGKAIFSTDSLL